MDHAAPRLLFVHAHVDEGRQLMRVLRAAGLPVTWTRLLRESLEFAAPSTDANMQFDCLLLDVTGFATPRAGLVQRFASHNRELPMLVLTDNEDLDSRLSLLESGADECLAKPVHLRELLTRMRVLHRRASGQSVTRRTFGTLTLDPLERTASVAEQTVRLTKTEFALLNELVMARGRVVSRETLLQRIWGHMDQPSDAVIEYYVHMLRRKVGRDAIRTVAGVGYAAHDAPPAARDTVPCSQPLSFSD